MTLLNCNHVTQFNPMNQYVAWLIAIMMKHDTSWIKKPGLGLQLHWIKWVFQPHEFFLIIEHLLTELIVMISVYKARADLERAVHCLPRSCTTILSTHKLLYSATMDSVVPQLYTLDEDIFEDFFPSTTFSPEFKSSPVSSQSLDHSAHSWMDSLYCQPLEGMYYCVMCICNLMSQKDVHWNLGNLCLIPKMKKQKDHLYT